MTMPLNQISNAANLLHQGRLVAFPTETVYGLGADAANEAALQAIFAAKNRPTTHPLIVHIASVAQLSDWAQDISSEALQLAKAFWPGPLTLILKKQPWVLDAVTGGQPTVGIRIPSHPIAQALLQAFGGGVAAPSANQFTHLSPTSAADVTEELAGKVDLILDGGNCEVGVESTIIDMTRETPIILRPGMITSEKISVQLGIKIGVYSPHTSSLETRAPGMHHLHYAPTTTTQLISHEDIPNLLTTETTSIVLLTHQSFTSAVPPHIKIVMMSEDPTRYAHDLYHTLREMDHQHFSRIVIEQVPATSEWEAINDRLRKACGVK